MQKLQFMHCKKQKTRIIRLFWQSSIFFPKGLAGILKSCVRGSDYVVRYGGDEFLVVLSETDQPGARIVLDRMRQKVEEWNQTHRIGDINISVSLGHYQHVAGETADQAIAESDSRMYADKQTKGTRGAVAPDAPTPRA